MKRPVVLSVSQLNKYIKSIIDGDINLQAVFVCGEISNFTNHSKTGHFYFTLKDGASAIKAVMFRAANAHLRFMPENSMSVIIRGRVGVFERDGVYQLYVDDMQPDGVGALSLAFEQLKNKLAAEGLFDPSRKKQIPKYPLRIGVITSPTGAAVRDIINILTRRFPLVTVKVCPVSVQGELAAGQIASALADINASKGADVLIVGRGGGSAEDLWAFNEEIVARAVAASDIPVISAVGHETDFTICDFVADLRAPTPSAAAELAVPDIREEKDRLFANAMRISSCVREGVAQRRRNAALISSRLTGSGPVHYINDLRVRCDTAALAAENCVRAACASKRADYAALCARLDTLSPLKMLSRGYSIASSGGAVVTSVSQVAKGDVLNVHVSNGDLACTVDMIMKG